MIRYRKKEILGKIDAFNRTIGADYGYIALGLASGNYSAVVHRMVFSTGITSANTVSNLSQARFKLSGMSDKILYGYFGGGNTGIAVNRIDKTTFSTGATSSHSSNLSVAKFSTTSLSDGNIYGYFAGGTTGSGTTHINTTDMITFSTGTNALNTVSNLSNTRDGGIGLSDGLTYGYFCGGNSSGSTQRTTVDRIVFSTSVTSVNTTSTLPEARAYSGGVSYGLYGYICGGKTNDIVASSVRMIFSTGVVSANTVSNLSEAKSGMASVSDGVMSGYFLGGTTNDSIELTTVDKILFSTGVTSVNTVSTLTVGCREGAGFSDLAV